MSLEHLIIVAHIMALEINGDLGMINSHVESMEILFPLMGIILNHVTLALRTEA
jgi:hypothetical protein